MLKKSTLLVAVLAIALFSCKKVVEEIQSIGTFTSTFTGAISQQFDGKAAFVHTIRKTSTPNGSALVVTLSKENDQSESIILTLSNTATTGIDGGTYTVNASAGSTDVFLPVYTNTGSTDLYIVDDRAVNSITLTSVESLRVKGEFELNLITASLTPQTVTIKGSFDAAGTTLNQ